MAHFWFGFKRNFPLLGNVTPANRNELNSQGRVWPVALVILGCAIAGILVFLKVTHLPTSHPTAVPIVNDSNPSSTPEKPGPNVTTPQTSDSTPSAEKNATPET